MEEKEKITIRVDKAMLNKLRKEAFLKKISLQDLVNERLKNSHELKTKKRKEIFDQIKQIRESTVIGSTDDLIQENKSEMK